MNIHTDKTNENKSQPVATATSQKQRGSEPAFQFVDNRPEAIAQKKLQEMANNSPQVKQLRAYQEMANNSLKVKQLKAYQSIANNHTSQTAQRSENSSVELPQNNKEPESIVQRKLKINGITYTGAQSNREFNRSLMLELQANHFKDVGTKVMWNYVGKQLNDTILNDSRTFVTWKAYLENLWEKGMMERVQKGTSMGPKNMGARPSFTTATEKEIVLNAGEHRRHIISSSSLGKGIETAFGLVKAYYQTQPKDLTLDTLNGWNDRHGGAQYNSEYDALRCMWSMVHNHTGNLFAGEGAANSAIGFIRAPLSALLKELKENQDKSIAVDAIVKNVEAIQPTMAWLKERWVEITKTLKETIQMADPVLSSVSLGAVLINCSAKYKGDDALVQAIYQNLDRLFNKPYIPVIDVLAELETTLQAKKFVKEKDALRSLWRSEIERLSFGSENISGLKAYQLVEEWIMNCDLDYPYGLVDKKYPDYSNNLAKIYLQVMSPNVNFFDPAGTLDSFMQLSFK